MTHARDKPMVMHMLSARVRFILHEWNVVTDLENKAHSVEWLCNIELNDILVEKSYRQVLLEYWFGY